ncbi:Cyclic nucleotide-binding protein [Pseudocohnilembus persalinus]|uniref:Cyclic nucleotide-binding protein n=1 Tax=Pseudocohnilembus persalinus TaxID=266149 RepID=A0A0V0QK00_PSEPJ|nr:Cyclic nucleotide-binding protein [Pseudocohnilembus persalinus]|eukprot:KRX02309.1 Cyclic nucleotide-binding protein [Pseudocohnilembus persalinus]
MEKSKRQKNNQPSPNQKSNEKQIQKNLEQEREIAKKPKNFGNAYENFQQMQYDDSSMQNSVQTIDNLLRNNPMCSSQYYNGPISLYKSFQTKQPGEYFGEIVHSGKGVQSNFTIVVSKKSYIIQISGQQYYQIFKNLIYKLNFVYQILELQFQGFSRKVLLEVALNSERKDYKQDQILYKERQVPDKFYVLKEGEVAIMMEAKKVKFIKSGELFGFEDLFYKNRKLSAISDSNKTVVFEIDKKKIKNYYFMKDLKQKGEPALINIFNVRDSSIKIQEQPSQSQIKNKQQNTTQSILQNQSFRNFQKSQNFQLQKFLSTTKAKMVDQSKSLWRQKSFNKQNPQIIYQSSQQIPSENQQNSKENLGTSMSFQKINNKTASSWALFGPKISQKNQSENHVPKVERFPMVKDQDIFNDEDYSKNHYNQIKQIKKANKIIFDGNKSIFLEGGYQFSQKQNNQNIEAKLRQQNNFINFQNMVFQQQNQNFQNGQKKVCILNRSPSILDNIDTKNQQFSNLNKFSSQNTSRKILKVGDSNEKITNNQFKNQYKSYNHPQTQNNLNYKHKHIFSKKSSLDTLELQKQSNCNEEDYELFSKNQLQKMKRAQNINLQIANRYL